jgi:pimeloyl-ACP methyl ester carboxylesterase
MVKNHLKDYLILPDSEIYYEVIGNGPPLIFAHGLGGNHLSWWMQIPYFCNRFTCITFSHRGFALSKNLSGKFSAKLFADDLNALIEHLNLSEVNIVAQSMGGWTALNYALRKKSKLKSLVMASTTGEINFGMIKHSVIQRLEEWKNESDKIKSDLKTRGLLPATGARMADEQPMMNFLYSQIYDLTPNYYKDLVRKEIRDARVLSPEVLKQLDIPVLFIAGEEDVVFPPYAAEAAASLINNSLFENVPKAGHSVYFERPDIFNTLVDRFLSSAAG